MFRLSSRRLWSLLLVFSLLVSMMMAASPSAAQGACSVTITGTLTNNTGEERTARARVIDTTDNGRIVFSADVTLQPNETRSFDITRPVQAGYLIILIRAGMLLEDFNADFTGDSEICDAVRVFIGDGRINDGFNQRRAPLAGYCTRRGGIEVYDIDSQGRGQLAFQVGANAIRLALEVASRTGQNQLIGEGMSDALYALTSGELQFQGPYDYNPADAGKVYNFIMPGDTCSAR